MNIGVVSDTHENINIFHKVVEAAAKYAGIIDHWLHAGDNYKDAFYLSDLTGAPVTAVAGNCDYRDKNIPYDEYLNLNEKTIWLTHGHRHNAKHTVADLVWWGQWYNAHAVVFGHTHIPYNQVHKGILIFNPGSLSYPREDNCLTFGIISINSNETGQVVLVGDIIKI